MSEHWLPEDEVTEAEGQQTEHSKQVTIFRAGGVARTDGAVLPGDSLEQLCALAAPELGWPAHGPFYVLVDPEGNPIEGDVYKAVNDGDELTLVQVANSS